jgi:hypothetical protein
VLTFEAYQYFTIKPFKNEESDVPIFFAKLGILVLLGFGSVCFAK